MDLHDFIESMIPKDGDIKDFIKETLNGTLLFGTIVCDAYKKEEKEEIYKALDIVCNRKGYFSFDHYGIYVFWNYYTKEILYIGLSKNLRSRFAQHNGIGKSSNIGNKFKQITEYFEDNELLGYSVLLQSPCEAGDDFLTDKDKEIREIEGALIQEFYEQNGELPKWNKMGGAVYGRKEHKIRRYGNVLNMINATDIDYLNAKSTLREIAEDEEKLEYESDLNPIRARMYKHKENFEKALEVLMKFNELLLEKGLLSAGYSNYRYRELIKSDYFKSKKLILK